MSSLWKVTLLLLAGFILVSGGYSWVLAQDSQKSEQSIGKMLEEMRIENERLLERQKAMLKQIETMREDARQARIFAKRS